MVFREMKKKQKAVGREQCIAILEREKRGVLSVTGDGGYPYATPMNHFYNRDDGCVYFHCGRGGHRLDAIERDARACFCVYDEGCKTEGDWALNITSVVVFGKIEVLDDYEKVADISARLSRKFTQDEGYISAEIEAYAKATLLLCLVPEHMSGKRIKES